MSFHQSWCSEGYRLVCRAHDADNACIAREHSLSSNQFLPQPKSPIALMSRNPTRLDEPLFSNVSGGFGIFGAYTLDSLVHLLPENFRYNNK